MKRLIASLLVVPSAALAHQGDHRFAEFPRLIAEPDHLAMIGLSVAILAYATIKLRARR